MTIFVLVILIFIILNQFSFFKPVTSNLQFVFSTVSRFTNEIYERVTTSPDSLRSQMNEMQRKLVAQSINASRLAQLEDEILELETELGYQENLSSRTISAKVLARSADKTQNLLIDKGSRDGLRPGLAVVVDDGELIGIVSEVEKNTAQIKLISDQTSKIPAMILNGEKTVGLVEGKGGFLLIMDFIPTETEINVDQIIVTSGLEGLIPAGLVIGSVSEVDRVDTELFVSADIEPFVDPNNYRRVLIIDPFADSEYDS